MAAILHTLRRIEYMHNVKVVPVLFPGFGVRQQYPKDQRWHSPAYLQSSCSVRRRGCE